MKNTLRHPFIAAALPALFAGALFLTTLYCGVGGRFNFGDSAKWQYLWIINGTPHSTGYPLFLMLTELFGNTLTFLTAPLRITLISTVFAVVAVIYLQRLILLLAQNHIASIAGAALMCVGMTFWIHATEAEVYSLNLAFHLSATYYFLLAAKTQNLRWLYLACFLYAMSFGNHLLMITMLPAIIFLTQKEMPKVYKNPKCILIIGAFILIGASQYYYLWHLAQHRAPWLEFIGYKPTFARFIDYITGGQFRGNFQFNPSLANLQQLLRIERKNELNYLVLLLAPAAALLHWKSADAFQRRALQFLLLQMIVLGGFCLVYVIPDISTYYLPLTACIIVLACLSTAHTRFNTARNILLVISVCYGFSQNLPKILRAPNPFNDWVIALRQALPDGATVYSPQGISIGHYGGFQGHSVWNYAKLDNKRITILMRAGDLKAANNFYFLIEDYNAVKNAGTFQITPVQDIYLLKDILQAGPDADHARIMITYNPKQEIVDTLRQHFSGIDGMQDFTRDWSLAAIQQSKQAPVVKIDRRDSSTITINTNAINIEALGLADKSGSRWRRHNGYYAINGAITPLHCGGISIIDVDLKDGHVANYYCLRTDRLESRSQPVRLFHATRG